MVNWQQPYIFYNPGVKPGIDISTKRHSETTEQFSSIQKKAPQDVLLHGLQDF